MKISVIIPTYKPENYIWDCLNSLKKQSLNKNLFEVLIILNGEKEPYFTEIRKFIKKNELINFKLFYSMEKGVSSARNFGLEICKGDYIAFIDDDDYVSFNYLEELLKKSDKETLVISNAFYFKDGTNLEIEKTWNFIENLNSKNILKNRKYFSTACMKLISKNSINNIRFNKNLTNGEDSIFMTEISKNIKYIKSTSEESIYYRRVRKNSANFRKRNKNEIVSSSFLQMKILLRLLNDKNYKKTFIFCRCLAVIKTFIKLILN